MGDQAYTRARRRHDGKGHVSASSSIVRRHALGRVIPICQVVPAQPATFATKNKVFLRHGDDEEGRPVAQDGQKVAEDGAKVLSPCNAGDGINNKHEDDPKEAGYDCERMAKSLDGECGRIRVGNVGGTVFFVPEACEYEAGSG